MLLPRSLRTSCPNCGNKIELTTAAKLQSARLGVSCECSNCSDSWICRVATECLSRQDRTEQPHSVQDCLRPKGARFTSSEPTVFIVDDDAGVRTTLTHLIEFEGLNLET